MTGNLNFLDRHLELIANNPALFLPICDHQSIDIALLLVLAVRRGADFTPIVNWLVEMTARLRFSVRTRGRYPCVFSEYRDIIDHPRDKSAVYFKEAAAGSTLIPLIAMWLAALHRQGELKVLADLIGEHLSDTTLQMWLPDDASEIGIYTGSRDHGVALCDLVVTSTGEDLMRVVTAACEKEDGIKRLTAAKSFGDYHLDSAEPKA